MGLARTILIWVVVAAAILVPLAAAAMSPQLQWRGPIYIIAGFAGIVAFGLILVQPLLIGGYLPGIPGLRGRRAHILVGGALVVAVVVHVAGLWITSPPDVVDALLFMSPTPFSAWGVIAMWALFTAAAMVAFRQKLRLRPRTWRTVHTILALVIAIGTIVHAVLIQGTMETATKIVLCALVFAAVVGVIAARRLSKA